MVPNLVQAVDEGLRASLSQFGTPSSWRFSDLGKCLRCQTLSRLGFDKHAEKSSLSSLFLMQMGHVIETEALEWLSRSTNVDILSKQVKVALPQFQAKGHMDALGLMGNYLVPIEIKSTRNKALEYRIPYKNHEKQAGGYAWAVNLPRAILLYIGRDGAFAQCVVENDAKLRSELSEEWETLNLYWDSMPDRKFTDNWKEDDETFYERVAPYLPPAPKVILEPILDKNNQPELYQRAGPWGPKGTPKTQLKNDGSCVYCHYPTYCCNSLPEDGEVLSGDVLGPVMATAALEDSPQPQAGTVPSTSQAAVGLYTRAGTPGKIEQAKVKTSEGWKEVPNQIIDWGIDANTGTQDIPEQQRDN